MRKIIVVVGVFVGFVGPANAEPSPPVQSVPYYKSDPVERADVLKKCRANPGELRDTPACVNAERGENLANGTKGGGLNVKPMTGISLGGKGSK